MEKILFNIKCQISMLLKIYCYFSTAKLVKIFRIIKIEQVSFQMQLQYTSTTY